MAAYLYIQNSIETSSGSGVCSVKGFLVDFLGSKFFSVFSQCENAKLFCLGLLIIWQKKKKILRSLSWSWNVVKTFCHTGGEDSGPTSFQLSCAWVLSSNVVGSVATYHCFIALSKCSKMFICSFQQTFSVTNSSTFYKKLILFLPFIVIYTL